MSTRNRKTRNRLQRRHSSAAARRRSQPHRGGARRPVRRGQSGSRLSTPMMIVAAAVVLAALAGVGYAAGIFKGVTDVVDVVRHIVYTAPTGNSSGLSLPSSVKADLQKVGLAQELSLIHI